MDRSPIVVGCDPSDRSDAAPLWAADEGARTGTPVHLVYPFEQFVTDLDGVGPVVVPEYASRADAQAYVQAAIAVIGKTHPDVAVSGSVVDGSATDILVDRSRQASLMVLGGQEGDVGSLLVRSLSVDVAANAYCSVVLVLGQEPLADAPVVVALTDSDRDDQALGFGFAQAAAHSTSIRVVHARKKPLSWRKRRTSEAEEQVNAEKARLNEAIAAWREKYPQVSTSVDLVMGKRVADLVEASRPARLLVVGANTEVGLHELLQGIQLLRHAPSPIAVIR
ncbi:universal stress protein [Phytohabitans sp. ZYX-F-186]|uniref:Universal stress protein n=1 Tax=Phytohabitans maris TaxID=3071409 RepID=A0ABU0ZRY5_9ACTN|nr:universal stress protein [Phytohabitans sp. ZYX-F-186]MDQ7909793.1 universal stress protein [Phytohabitans sp. ZYX-F-186]